MIKAVNITMHYKRQKILDSISFQAEEGEILGVLGPNGAGKTTLLSITASIIRPSSGYIYLNGKDIFKNRGYSRKLTGYVPQDIALYEELTVKDNILFYHNKGNIFNKKDKRDKIQKIGGMMGIDKEIKKRVKELSGGMKRRVNIAAALINDPQVLIMDEPFAGVDFKARNEIMSHLKILASKGKTIICSTHDMDILVRICDKSLLIDNGKQIYYARQFKNKNNMGLTEKEGIFPGVKSEIYKDALL